MATNPTIKALSLTNPWATAPHTPEHTEHTIGHAQAPQTSVLDVMGSAAFPPAMYERIARTADSKELARAFTAGLFDKHDRKAIFRSRMADAFPHAAAIIHNFDLPEQHDYNKLLGFIETGRWPKNTPNDLMLFYPRLINAVFSGQEDGYRTQMHQQTQKMCNAHGLTYEGHIESAVMRSTSHMCDMIRNAYHHRSKSLHFHEQFGIPTLPDHICSLAHLEVLTLSKMSIEALPHNLGLLKNLKELRLIKCPGVTELPESMRHLQHLETVTITRLSTNRPKKLTLPTWLASLPALKGLDIEVENVQRPAWLPEHISFQNPFNHQHDVESADEYASSLADDLEGMMID